ncbi:MAG: apolipoprotein N-acyltransferase [Jatrophihabitans sp.]|uniref:apolipoprotein N-acyltransferase n=1 Tax=Jatrophihabitans sp. TaxID=1932789 RepID=UPI003F7FB724
MRAVTAPFDRRWAVLVAVAGGLLAVLAFPRFDVWPLAFIGVAALSVAVEGRTARTAAWLGYLHGLAFLLPLLHWTGIYVGPVPWLILCVALAGFFALLGAVLAVLQRLPGAPLWVGTAWVLQELLRDRLPFGGFPWGRLAFSQAASPLRWFAALGGAPLVTFAVAVVGGLLAAAVLRLTSAPARRRAVALGAGAVVAGPLLGLLLGAVLAPDARPATLQVALVQGGLPNKGLAFEDRARQVLDNHVQGTLALAADVAAGRRPQPDLVLWPENASDVDPISDPLARAEVERAVQAVHVPILVGAIRSTGDEKYRLNEGILWSPSTGPGATYVKRHPVPFGEYIPLRSIAERISPDAKLVANDMVSGRGDGLLRGGPVPLGDVICFEVAYDSLVQSSVAAGAQVLVVQTNNATFGHTAETYQQLAMARLRAVETDRTVLQVATTGKSAVIDPDGTVAQESGPLFSVDVLSAAIASRTDLTLAVRVGAAPEWVLGTIAAAGVAWAIVAGRRRRDGYVAERRPGVEKEWAQT